jgi:hypothetical protein
MRVSLSIHSAKGRGGVGSPDHGMYVAWAELDGIDITGPLARSTDRDVVEQRARLELAHRLQRILGPRIAADVPDRVSAGTFEN